MPGESGGGSAISGDALSAPSREPIVTCLHHQPFVRSLRIDSLLFTTSSFTNILRPPPRVLESLSLSSLFLSFSFPLSCSPYEYHDYRLGYAPIVASARKVRSRTRARTHTTVVLDKHFLIRN